MEFKPGDPTTVYACGNQFYRSTNNGVTWNLITGGPLPTAAGCSRMAIAVTAADVNRKFVCRLPAPNYGTEGFYSSTNSGTSFTQPSTPNIGNQQWYDLCIASSRQLPMKLLLADKHNSYVLPMEELLCGNGVGTHVDYAI